MYLLLQALKRTHLIATKKQTAILTLLHFTEIEDTLAAIVSNKKK